MLEKVRKMRENQKKGLKTDIQVENYKVQMGERWHRWQDGRWRECEERRENRKQEDENKIQQRLHKHRAHVHTSTHSHKHTL